MNERLKGFFIELAKQAPVVVVLLGIGYIYYKENKEYRHKNDARMIILEEQVQSCTKSQILLLTDQLEKNTVLLERLDRKTE